VWFRVNRLRFEAPATSGVTRRWPAQRAPWLCFHRAREESGPQACARRPVTDRSCGEPSYDAAFVLRGSKRTAVMGREYRSGSRLTVFNNRRGGDDDCDHCACAGVVVTMAYRDRFGVALPASVWAGSQWAFQGCCLSDGSLR
jgi:hypothetical protein